MKRIGLVFVLLGAVACSGTDKIFFPSDDAGPGGAGGGASGSTTATASSSGSTTVSVGSTSASSSVASSTSSGVGGAGGSGGSGGAGGTGGSGPVCPAKCVMIGMNPNCTFGAYLFEWDCPPGVVPDGTCIVGNASNLCQNAQSYCCL